MTKYYKIIPYPNYFKVDFSNQPLVAEWIDGDTSETLNNEEIEGFDEWTIEITEDEWLLAKIK
tara:strand:- start:757 stop:945 length:189 start_codon:yes stop_codon:yes gene_type:complete